MNTNNNWSDCKKILCIRPDNLGDLLMSSPAIRALKSSFNCHITLLTSSMAKGMASFIPEIDEVICFDLPWVKTNASFNISEFNTTIEDIRNRQFDAAVIFTVYSQNPLPSVMLAFLAGISRRLAYCRENPYALLTDWVPDKEPYSFIRHQVQRDLDLVSAIGAHTDNVKISIKANDDKLDELKQQLTISKININKPWVILHAGVSEPKREFSVNKWIALAKSIIHDLDHQVLFTGTASEDVLTAQLAQETGNGAFNLAGKLSLQQFILLIKISPLVISVNTGTIHIAAGVGTPVIVLYALTNPQHAPWKSTGKIFPFAVPLHLQSRNEVIRHVSENIDQFNLPEIKLPDIISAARDLLFITDSNESYLIPELVEIPVYAEEML